MADAPPIPTIKTVPKLRDQHLRDMADCIGFLSMDAVQQAKSGHPGAPLGMADIATFLFRDFMQFDSADPHWFDRDRFVLSNGHASMLLYSLLYLTGFKDMTLDELKRFRQIDSKTAGHPEYKHADSIETTTGPLGQGGLGDASPPNTISVGSPPRVVGHSRFEADSVLGGRYILNQAMLAPLQWVCLSASNVAGFVAMGLCFNALVFFAPIWAVWIALLILPTVPRLVKTAFVPLFKWIVLGKITAGEFPAYGWTYCRWVLLETVIMDAEPAFLTQLHGTLWLNLLWRSLGARVGSNACILASSLGCEFDLKDVGDETVLHFQSLVFGHSIEHHALLFKPAKIGSRAEVGAGAIVEAGAVVDYAGIVPPSRPVHARQGRTTVENTNSFRPSVAQPSTLSKSPPQHGEHDDSAILIDHTELSAMARAIFVASGSSEEEARLVADHLVEANLSGHDSHGVGMIPMYLRNLARGTLRANCIGRVASDQGAMIVYDGERGYGQVVARAAIEIGIEQARRAGLAVVALRNAHHIGRIGTYGEMCADAGLISIHFVNITDQKPSVAPWLGGDARFGTNPVCVAVPAAESGRPIILDMATSVIALGKVRVARNKDQQLGPSILLGTDGQPTTDPGVMFRQPRGALMTFGEHKGYALAFICEILGGALTGGGTMRPENQAAATTTNGMLSIVIDPSRLVERSWLDGEIKAMTDYVTASPPIRPGEKVLIPGDPERQARTQRIAAGIPIDHETWREIVDAANSLNVPIAIPRGDLRRYSPTIAAGM
jgi:hydroxycarboxylate dehydrogenase B